MKAITAVACLRLALLCAAVTSCLLPFRAAQAVQFIPLGWETYPSGVSGDGAFVVGTGSLIRCLAVDQQRPSAESRRCAWRFI